MKQIVESEIGGRKITLHTGELAKHAHGSVVVQYGDTMVLATATCSSEPKNLKEAALRSFIPLTVDYRERMSAAGKIPGGFFKREGRPREKEILTSRLIDRSLRPLFNKNFMPEVQVIITVLSSDCENDPDVLAIIGASCALSISKIPFAGPVGSVRVAYINDEFVINPLFTQLSESKFDIVVSATKDKIVMVEGGAKEVSEDLILKALKLAHESIQDTISVQEDLLKKSSQPNVIFEEISIDTKLKEQVEKCADTKIQDALTISDRILREKTFQEIYAQTWQQLKDNFPDDEGRVISFLEEIKKCRVRSMIINEQKRIDGRALDEVRPITCAIGVLPRTHGSGLFTRGQTQALVTTTLGTISDMQIMDELEGEYKKKFMLHYNFPPFSVCEVRPQRGPGRREIGHGALAERALLPVLPSDEVFPYTIRLVSDILESNGSSSMASVCGSSLALMDAGVPISSPVAGVAIGCIIEDDKVEILTDILGVEDHCGDMDFKVAGTHDGITAIQLDVKVNGITLEIIREALSRALEGKLFILSKMEELIKKPRTNLSEYAPQMITMQIATDKIRDVIGPGGKIIRKIIEDTGAKIDIDDDGKIYITADNAQSCSRAQEMVQYYIADVEIGKTYKGKVTKIMAFGAFVEILPNKEGLVHISQLSNKRVNKVEDVVKEGDEIMVKVMEINEQGKVNLSRKAVLGEEQGK